MLAGPTGMLRYSGQILQIPSCCFVTCFITCDTPQGTTDETVNLQLVDFRFVQQGAEWAWTIVVIQSGRNKFFDHVQSMLQFVSYRWVVVSYK